MGKGGKGIPEKWEQFTNMGHQIPGTRFIPFKVPLKHELLNNLDISVAFFDVRSVMDHCSNLGLIIDLTNTNRYYSPSEFLENDVSYYKLKTFGNIPADPVVFKFFEVVAWFLAKNKHNNKLIGVHCTNGVNRTGYMIIRYMIQQLNVPPDEAISAFNSARGHTLEKEDFLEDLRKSLWPMASSFPLQKTPRSAHERVRLREDTVEGYVNQTPPYFPLRSKSRLFQNIDNQPSLVRERPSPYSVSVKSRLSILPPPIYSESDVESPVPQNITRQPFVEPDLGLPESHLSETTSPYSTFDRRRLGLNNPLIGSPSSFDKRRLSLERNASLSVFDKRRLGPDPMNFVSPDSLQPSHHTVLPLLDEPLPANFAVPTGESHDHGLAYYQQYFGDRAYAQYDSDFYTRGGSGIGPHRPPPRNLPIPQYNGGVPRVYRGPKPYHPPSPPVEELEFTKTSLNPEAFSPYFNRSPISRLGPKPVCKSPGDFLVPVDGPRRNVFSPGTRNNIFSPENEWSPRLRSNRFQPY